MDEATSLAAWLPGFYDNALVELQAEARWCSGVFPSHVCSLLTALSGSLAERARDGFRARLADALDEAQAAGATADDAAEAAAAAAGGALTTLLSTHGATTAFVQGLCVVLAGVGADSDAVQVRARCMYGWVWGRGVYMRVPRKDVCGQRAWLCVLWRCRWVRPQSTATT